MSLGARVKSSLCWVQVGEQGFACGQLATHTVKLHQDLMTVERNVCDFHAHLVSLALWFKPSPSMELNAKRGRKPKLFGNYSSPLSSQVVQEVA